MASFKPREVISILYKLGYITKRQTGSHAILFNPVTKKTIPVPIHSKEIKKGLLQAIIKQADSTEKEFLHLK